MADLTSAKTRVGLCGPSARTANSLYAGTPAAGGGGGASSQAAKKFPRTRYPRRLTRR